MARARLDEAGNYAGQGGAGFFQLQDDGDTAEVRFMYETIDDVQLDILHSIDTGKKNKFGNPISQYVDCLRTYKDPVDACPFCREGKTQLARLIIPIYDVDQNKTFIWDRGRKYFKRFTKMSSRYPNLVSQVFEIERDGVRGDQQTEYTFEAVGQPDDTTLEDLPPVPDVRKGYIWEKTKEEMEYFLEQEAAGVRPGKDMDLKDMFPPTGDDDDEDEAPVRRKPSRERDEAPARRRTPARRHTDEDSF